MDKYKYKKSLGLYIISLEMIIKENDITIDYHDKMRKLFAIRSRIQHQQNEVESIRLEEAKKEFNKLK